MKLLSEPLLHFTVSGAILFSAYAWLSGNKPPSDGVEPVRIGAGEIQWLKQTYSSQWLRPPDTNELQGLVTNLVTEELFAREAQAIGLGENDTIIRRRLAQKLKFLVEDTSRLAEPTDAELRRYFEANAPHFEEGPQLSFSQIYFNPESRKDPVKDARLVLAGLSADVNVEEAKLGDRLLLETELAHADRQAVANAFGTEFADALLAVEPGKWTGPLKSGYGMHLVFVSERQTARMPPFEAVRDKVVTEWRRESEQKASQDYLAQLRQKYGVKVDDSAKAQLEPQPATNVSMR
ncbi:peptidyl-prolyl cis-trans isomerase [Mesorhizobium sp. CGMCC 1.15528]|uniref:Parvulin-like PPIase n=1 Tax=Mesorhizobium zhangyense TaxID=1776730 RepID=A0A7C9VB78_9HYPH|nr:peptidylprolyl isomerase [Mesorhizobium zhangyense]NGN44463.1 peptidyl-prolyl cis-trans isomerase [Mesorhizobium zhangyense]